MFEDASVTPTVTLAVKCNVLCQGLPERAKKERATVQILVIGLTMLETPLWALFLSFCHLRSRRKHTLNL